MIKLNELVDEWDSKKDGSRDRLMIEIFDVVVKFAQIEFSEDSPDTLKNNKERFIIPTPLKLFEPDDIAQDMYERLLSRFEKSSTHEFGTAEDLILILRKLALSVMTDAARKLTNSNFQRIKAHRCDELIYAQDEDYDVNTIATIEAVFEECLTKCPKKLLAFELYNFRNMSINDIAIVMDKSTKTIRSYINQIKALMLHRIGVKA